MISMNFVGFGDSIILGATVSVVVTYIETGKQD